MNKLILFFVTFVLVTGIAVAQTPPELDAVTGAFEDFSEGVATSLPLASTIGLNWNDAYMKGFPRGGVGITTGAAFIPVESFEGLTDAASGFDIGEVQEILDVVSLGLPLPVVCLDARLGLPILPMDVGLKYGTIPESAKEAFTVSDLGFDYNLVGFDVRYAILEGKGLMPKLTVGAGYTYMNGNITMPGPPSQTIDLPAEMALAGYNTLDLVPSDINFGWSANIIDLKAQASVKLAILSLSAGLGYSHGFTEAGGGMSADVFYNGNQEIDSDLQALLAEQGMDLDANGFEVLSETDGGNFRLFGGVGLNIFILKLDIGAIYGLADGSLGLSSNLRVQW